MYSVIVTGTDGSDSAAIAVSQAAQLAKLCGARLVLVSAVSAPSMVGGVGGFEVLQTSWIDASTQAATEVLERAIDGVTDLGIEVVAEVVTGDPAGELLQACERHGADLLVVGNRGMQGMRRFVLGSVASRCAHHAPCAVLIVPTA